MTRHQFPDGPWPYLAIHLMGPLLNQESFLVIIDYYSRYQELAFMNKTTSTEIIRVLTRLFSRMGLPKSIRSDNGRQFTSKEFTKHCEDNIILIHTPPYWPQVNGEVENMNKSILKRLQISYNSQLDNKTEIEKFILMYNVTPHGTTGKSPSELVFNRRIRDKIQSINDVTVEEPDEEAKDIDILKKNRGRGKEKRREKRNTIQ